LANGGLTLFTNTSVSEGSILPCMPWHATQAGHRVSKTFATAVTPTNLMPQNRSNKSWYIDTEYV
jgi:hypothetical protein